MLKEQHCLKSGFDFNFMVFDGKNKLIENVEEFKKTLPMKRLGEPEEIGNFVKAIIENKIKYLSGVTINFDGANSNYIF